MLAAAPLPAIEAGLAQPVPLLIGTNQDEYKLFTLGNRQLPRMNEEGLRHRLAQVLAGKGPDGTPVAELALEFYGPESVGPGRATPGERWIAFQSDRIFHWPAARLADAHTRSRGATYAYLFRWQPPLLRSRLGACHGLEIPFVFGTLRCCSATPAARNPLASMGCAASGSGRPRTGTVHWRLRVSRASA